MDNKSHKHSLALCQEYPFENHYIEQSYGTNSVARQHYLDEGTGPVILMLHGNPTWSFYFRNCIHSLKKMGFRCIVPDHMGCGLSDKPRDYPYTLEQRIEDTERLVTSLNINNFSLLVHDWGGAIGMGLAVRNSEKVERIAILNSGAYLSNHMPRRIGLLRTPGLGQFLIRGLNLFAWPATTMSVEVPLSASVKAGYLFPYGTWAKRIAVWNFVKDIPMKPSDRSYDCLATIEAKLELLKGKKIGIFWGQKDFCFNAHFLKRWTEIFPEAKTVVYKDAGHYILEDAQKEVIPAISEFLVAH